MTKIIIREKNTILKKFLFLIINIFIISCILSSFTFANNDSSVIAKDKEKVFGDELIIDKNNSVTLYELAKIMDINDLLLIKGFIEEYTLGKTDRRQMIKDVIAKYNTEGSEYILEYLLDNPSIHHLGAYYIYNDEAKYGYIKGISSEVETVDQRNYIDIIWPLMKRTVPSFILSNIRFIILEQNRFEDDLLTISAADDRNSKFDIHIDTNLTYRIDILQNEIAAATVMMYVLDSSEVDFNKKKGTNYKFNNLYYKDDSIINKYYELFWKGRKVENSDGQYEKYQKEFLNQKASLTVYNDIAVMFIRYLKFGIKSGGNTPINKKQNFFDDYEDLKDLAFIMRENMGFNTYFY